MSTQVELPLETEPIEFTDPDDPQWTDLWRKRREQARRADREAQERAKEWKAYVAEHKLDEECPF